MDGKRFPMHGKQVRGQRPVLRPALPWTFGLGWPFGHIVGKYILLGSRLNTYLHDPCIRNAFGIKVTYYTALSIDKNTVNSLNVHTKLPPPKLTNEVVAVQVLNVCLILYPTLCCMINAFQRCDGFHNNSINRVSILFERDSSSVVN